MPPVDVQECPVCLSDYIASLQSVAVVPETFGSLAQELFDRMSMLAKNAVRLILLWTSIPPSLSKILKGAGEQVKELYKWK